MADIHDVKWIFDPYVVNTIHTNTARQLEFRER